MKRAAVVVAVGALLGCDKNKPADLSTWLPKAIETAKQADQTMEPIEATATAVTPDGQLLAGDALAALSVRFRSPPGAAPPALLAAPGTPAAGCAGGLVTLDGSQRAQWQPAQQRCLPALTLPRCTFRQIWAKAKAKGAPDRAAADIDLTLESGRELRWRFELVDRPANEPPRTVFHTEFADDC